MERTTRAPIEVPAGMLHKAPAIIINPGDEIRIGHGWYKVIANAKDTQHSVTAQGSNEIKQFHVGLIDEWRKR